MNSDSLDTAYTRSEATEYDQNRFTSPGGACVHAVEFGHVSRFLAAHNARPESRLLEIGCGTGHLLAELDHQENVTGIDLSEHMLEKARQRFSSIGGPTLICGNAADMAFEDNIFDLAYSVRLLNRVGTKQVADRIVGEAARVTKVGGYILFEMTNSARLHRGKGTVAFTKGEFEQILRKWNLDVTHVEGAFVLGIGPWTSGGRRFHNVAEIVDRVLLRLSPSLGARIYFTAKVGER